MSNLKIIDDNENVKFYNLLSFNISRVDESLLLELVVAHETIRYEIHSDIREKNIELIEDFISQELNLALAGKKVVDLSEYLARSYIFIGDNTNQRQFTGNKK